jgi:hypothetical protein
MCCNNLAVRRMRGHSWLWGLDRLDRERLGEGEGRGEGMWNKAGTK